MSPPPNDSVGKPVKGRLAALDKVMKTAHKKVVGDKPHLYVLLFASDPELQGKGCGAALLHFICELADADSVDTYLETGFYTAKGGFEVSMILLNVQNKICHDNILLNSDYF
jgi:GNAT superfamily N-acetyltransferase